MANYAYGKDYVFDREKVGQGIAQLAAQKTQTPTERGQGILANTLKYRSPLGSTRPQGGNASGGSAGGSSRGAGSAGNGQEYANQFNELYSQIMGYGPFSYDLNDDMLYQQLSDRYNQMGKTAMQDTMGTAASLTGGYGNSYAQQVGQQAYQQFLTGLNDQVPELYGLAYDTWAGEYDRLLQLYQLAAEHPEYLAAMTPNSGGSMQSLSAEPATAAQGSTGSGSLLWQVAKQIAANINPLDNWYYQLLGAAE